MDSYWNHNEGSNQTMVEMNPMGEKNMFQNGELIATQKPGLFPNTTDTFSSGEKVAQTRENIMDGVDIIQDGKVAGIIKEDVMGNTSLYDANHQKLGYIEPSGNIKEVMTHNDPLSQANRVNFQQLKFYSE